MIRQDYRRSCALRQRTWRSGAASQRALRDVLLTDGDGRTEDLNGDGRIGNSDVDVFYELVERFIAHPQAKLQVGGLGKHYRTAYHHGSVHVDARGYRAR